VETFSRTGPRRAIANGGRSFTGRALFCSSPCGRLHIILRVQSLALHSTDTLTQYTTTSLGCWIHREMQTGEYVHGKEKTILSSTRQFDSAGPPQPNCPLGRPPTPPVTTCM